MFSASEGEKGGCCRCCRCCPRPVARVHKAGAGSSGSNQVAGHDELEEFSQRNSFAYFCFGLLGECFFSALVDGFQAEGTLGNEREKAVTHCTRRKGTAVTHGSWRGRWCAPRRRCCAEPPSTGPGRPRHGRPSTPPATPARPRPPPAASQHRLQLLCPHWELGTRTRCSTPPAEVTLAMPTPRGQAAGSAAPPGTSPARAGEGGGRKAVWTWQPQSTVCSRGGGRVAETSIVLKHGRRQGHAESGGGGRGISGPRWRPRGQLQQSLPGALGNGAVRSEQLEFIS